MAQTADTEILPGAKLIGKCKGNSSSPPLLLGGLKFYLFYKQGVA